MLNAIWVNAWILSSLISLGVFLLLRRSGLTRGESVLLALVCFPAPLFSLVNGAASFVYAADIVPPIAIYAGCDVWRRATKRIRTAALLIVIAGGLVPLLVVAVFSGDRNPVQFGAINAYRLMGAVMLMVRLSVGRAGRPIDSRWWRLIFSWISAVVLAAMLLQAFCGISSDVSNAFALRDAPDVAEIRFSVLGLFRGSLGIIGLLAVCAYLAGEKDRGWKHLLSLTGALCGCTVILLSGSKTSLIAVALVLSLRTLMARSSNAWRMAAILIAVILSLSGNVGVSRYLSPTLVNFFESQGQKRETLDSRMDVWRACERAVRANPIIALGAPLRRVMPVLPAAYASQGPYLAGVYHSEYLSIFMLGGIWNLTIYGLGLWLLGKEFMAGGFARPQKRFATLVFLGGLLESTTCAHLGPGLFYVCTAPLFATVYGLGARDDCLRVHWPRVIIRLGNHVGISYRSHHVQKSQGRTQGRSRLGSPSDHER